MKIIIFFIIAGLLGCYGRDPEKTGLEGKTMPSFSVLLDDSTSYFNTNNLPKGTPAVLFYYSPRCPYCRAQMHEIIDDIHKLKDIKICLVTNFPISEMRKFSKEFELEKYPNIISGKDTTTFFANYFEVPGVPYIAIYGKDKKLNEAFIGKVYSSQIKRIAFN